MRCQLEQRVGLACFYSSEYLTSARAFERAAAASTDPAQAAQLTALAAQSDFWGHDYDRARAATEAILALPEIEAGPAARAMAYNLRGFSAAVLDADVAAGDRHCLQGMALAEGRFPDVEATIRFNRTLFAEWTGEYRQAIELAERVMAAGKELRLAHLVVWPYWFLGKARCCLGDYGGALAQLEEGYQICDRIGDRAWKSRLLNTIGWCLGEIGCHERARDYDLRAAEVARRLGDPEIVANSEINLALDHLALGRIDEACGLLEPVETALSHAGDPWMRWRYSLHGLHARAQIDLVRGAPERVLVSTELALAGARQHRAPKLEARALVDQGRALLELERWDDAQHSLEQALQVAARIATPRAAWLAHGLLSALHRGRGRTGDAGRHAHAHDELVTAAAHSLTDTSLRAGLLASAGRPQ